VRTGLEGSFTQTTERYGVDFQLRDVLPVSLSINAITDSLFGESLDRIVDTTSDRVSIKSRKVFSSGDRIALRYEIASRNSRNGDPNRTIQETLRRSRNLLFTSNWRLGSRDQLYIDQTANFNRRDNPDVTDLNFAPRIRWLHSSTLESRYAYSFNQSERPDTLVKNRAEMASAALHYSPTPTLNGFVRAHVDRSEEKGRLMQDAIGLTSRGSYKKTFRRSQLNVSLGLGYELKDRESLATEISIIEEVVVLVGTLPISLSRDFVIGDSVIVRNETSTQILDEGVDYRLIEIGSQTQIERLIGGSILDGETVLVDYEAQTGGTFEYSQTSQTVNADFKFAKYHNIFLRYRNNKQVLESGFSTLPFNSVKSVEIGLREQLPLRWMGLQIYGEARYLDQDEDINPFKQKTMTVFNANLNWRASKSLTVRAEGYYDKDTGGTILRSMTKAKLKAQWRYRKISVEMDARYEEQQQGDIRSDNYEYWLRIRRELF